MPFFGVKVCVFLESDKTDMHMHQIFSEEKTLVYYNLHWKALHPAFEGMVFKVNCNWQYFAYVSRNAETLSNTLPKLCL